jgi:Rv2632c-like
MRPGARLPIDDDTRPQGTGWARRNPRDAEMPEIDNKLAAARALTNLAAKRRSAAAEDVEWLTQKGGLTAGQCEGGPVGRRVEREHGGRCCRFGTSTQSEASRSTVLHGRAAGGRSRLRG